VGDLSPHFSRAEFDCHDGSISDPNPRLIECLEALRGSCDDRPLVIMSGYRSPAWNRHVGGAKRSQHLLNRAADIHGNYATVDQALAAGFTGIGFCGAWVVHVDVRTGRRAIFKDC
jgi:zinc D-Ala-D-Ala carboxypeptidase